MTAAIRPPSSKPVADGCKFFLQSREFAIVIGSDKEAAFKINSCLDRDGRGHSCVADLDRARFLA